MHTLGYCLGCRGWPAKSHLVPSLEVNEGVTQRSELNTVKKCT